MINDKGILIKNIYYMLTYAFQVLKQTNYDEIASEEFEEIQDLFASILAKGISQQLKQGLHREYIGKNESLPVLRGKLDIQGTIVHRIGRQQVLACTFDELSENNLFNQILKTTVTLLVFDRCVTAERKRALKRILLFFEHVDPIDPLLIDWSRLAFQRNNRNYRMLMNICYFILDGLLLTTDKGDYRMGSFSDDHMARLYEKFVLEFFRKHHPHLHARSSQVKWDLDEQNSDRDIQFLPVMQTDILLRKDDQTLIIDTKYYSRTMQSQFDKHTLHSNNLYQIYAYVKNHDARRKGQVSGMLLYAKTEEMVTPDCEYMMGGNRIMVKTLELNAEFKWIAAQLDQMVASVFH